MSSLHRVRSCRAVHALHPSPIWCWHSRKSAALCPVSSSAAPGQWHNREQRPTGGVLPRPMGHGAKGFDKGEGRFHRCCIMLLDALNAMLHCCQDILCCSHLLQVCIFDNYFTDATATNICRFMGKPTPGRAVRGSFWGSGDGFVWLDRLACSYNPTTFTDCISRGWGMPDVRCSSAGMAGIVCGAEPSK